MTARLDSPGNASPVHMPEEGCAERWRLRLWSIFGGQAMSLAGSSLTQFVLLCFRISQAARETRHTGLWSEFREGIYLVWHTPGLRQPYLFFGTVVLAVMPTFVLVPLLVKVHFGGGASQVALMEGLAGGVFFVADSLGALASLAGFLSPSLLALDRPPNQPSSGRA